MLQPSVRRVAERFLSPEQQWRQDESARARHQREARREFRALLDAFGPVLAEAQALFPGTDEQNLKRQRGAVAKRLKDSPEVAAFLDRRIGREVEDERATAWRNSVLNLLRDVLFGAKGINKALEALDTKSANGFQARELAVDQAPLKAILPPELRVFLPPNVVVNVDEQGNIQRVTDRFEQQYKTMGEKIRRMKLIVGQYNAIAKKVKLDLKSSDEITRMAAAITAILMETGIRPGRAGNATVQTVDGEDIEVETFGATTLGAEHVRFVRGNFAQLEFTGKAGTVNTATLTDGQIIGVLRDFVEKARTTGSKYIWVTSDGRQFTNRMLDTYFGHNFKGIAPTDFRKLRATEMVLQGLRDRQEALYEQIRAFAQEEAANLRERIVQTLVQVIEGAVAEARQALSHDSGVGVTQKSYINPEVLLRFLSTGRAAANLEEAILKGTGKLAFDPMTFVQMAGVAPRAQAAGLKRATLGDLLSQLEQDLETPFMEL